MQHVSPYTRIGSLVAGALMLFAAYVVAPAAANAAGTRDAVSYQLVAFGVVAGGTAFAVAFMVAIMPSTLFERATKDGWMADLLMPLRAKSAVWQIIRGCWLTLLPVAMLSAVAAGLLLVYVRNREVALVFCAVGLGAWMLGLFAAFGTSAVTLRFPGRPWPQGLVSIASMLVFPIALLAGPFMYARVLKRIESEPSTLDTPGA